MLASRMRAFPTGGDRADVTIALRHADDPAIALPAPAPPARRLFEPQHPVDYFPGREMLYLRDDGVASSVDLARGSIETALRRDDPRAAQIASHLFFTLPLLELLKRRGSYAIHAAGVTYAGRAVLIAGPSGVGKSTLAVACALAGWGFLGDDVVLIGEPARVRAFPDEIDLTAESIALFPVLARAAAAPSASGKRAISPLDLAFLRRIGDAEIGAIVFPSRASRSALTPIDPDDALERLVPNVVRTSVREAQAHLDVLARLARTAPSFTAVVSSPSDAPRLFERALAARA